MPPAIAGRWRRACAASSPSATCARARSSAWRQRWARGHKWWPPCIPSSPPGRRRRPLRRPPLRRRPSRRGYERCAAAASRCRGGTGQDGLSGLHLVGSKPAIRCAAVVLVRQRAQGSSAVAHKGWRSEEHTSELQSRENLVCRLLLEKKKKNIYPITFLKKKKTKKKKKK